MWEIYRRSTRQESEHLAVGVTVSFVLHVLVLFPFGVAMVTGGESGRFAPRVQTPVTITVGQPDKTNPQQADKTQTQPPARSKRQPDFKPSKHDLIVALVRPRAKKEQPHKSQRNTPAQRSWARTGVLNQETIIRDKGRHRKRADPRNHSRLHSHRNQKVKARARIPKGNIGNRGRSSDGIKTPQGDPCVALAGRWTGYMPATSTHQVEYLRGRIWGTAKGCRAKFYVSYKQQWGSGKALVIEHFKVTMWGPKARRRALFVCTKLTVVTPGTSYAGDTFTGTLNSKLTPFTGRVRDTANSTSAIYLKKK